MLEIEDYFADYLIQKSPEAKIIITSENKQLDLHVPFSVVVDLNTIDTS